MTRVVGETDGRSLASYYTVEVDGRPNKGGAWTYRHPSPLARRIKDHVALGGDVEVSPAEGNGRTALEGFTRSGRATDERH